MAARFGDMLLEQRRRMGLSIQQVANTIKITPQIIGVFETGNFASMPPRGYAQGMISSYARFLGLNPREVVNAYFDELMAYERETSQQGGQWIPTRNWISVIRIRRLPYSWLLKARDKLRISNRISCMLGRAGYITETGSGEEIRSQRDRFRSTPMPEDRALPAARGVARDPRAGYGDGGYSDRGHRGISTGRSRSGYADADATQVTPRLRSQSQPYGQRSSAPRAGQRGYQGRGELAPRAGQRSLQGQGGYRGRSDSNRGRMPQGGGRSSSSRGRGGSRTPQNNGLDPRIVYAGIGAVALLLIVLIVALILSGLLARRLSRRIVDPLNSLDLEHPLDNDAYEELSPLLKRIHHQHVEIQTQLRELREKTDEFTQITGSMREGLVLLDEHGSILSINAAAQALFGADAQCVGRDFLTIERSHEISAAIQAAAADGHSEVRAERAGRVYQFDISRITSDGKFLGTVILAFDITEQEFAERNRREFTANITHELKTPLTAISGYAELIANGMVEGEDDLRNFGGRIYREAGRLAALVNDILTLSNLDEAERATEGEAVPIGSTEPIELSRAIYAVEQRLEQVARQANVTISHETKPVVIEGVSRLVDELIYNLASNAIRYNRPGGTVTLQCGTNDEGHPFLAVADTGIGIAPEEQGKVFERFYRVDKSRSKARGGTGLGLAIVKHAALYHHATLDLSSELGVGTTITVTFPIQQDEPFA